MVIVVAKVITVKISGRQRSQLGSFGSFCPLTFGPAAAHWKLTEVFDGLVIELVDKIFHRYETIVILVDPLSKSLALGLGESAA